MRRLPAAPPLAHRPDASPLTPLRALVAVATVAVGLVGCATVKPYERETLSLRPMTAESEQLENHFRQHWQDSREGATGGYASAGGGCGCN